MTEWSTIPAGFHPPICLYGVAMSIRGELDGSSEGCTPWEELRPMWDYLRRRCDEWGPSTRASEAAFLVFLECVLAETEANLP